MTTYFPETDAWVGFLRYSDSVTSNYVDVYTTYDTRNSAVQGAQGNLQNPYENMGAIVVNVIWPATSLPAMNS